MDNALYLFSAYSIAWIIIFLYSFSISKRQQSLENQIAEMKEALRKDVRSSGSP
ncbi:MAG: CcmD family protein [Deltaproteobacteria bacterium]|jgi:CcmD family protein|nr:CcmD family protein [Deltaproteobacteria bacterium]